MDFFKRPPPKTSRDPFEPIPVPEAQESDWAEWVDSITAQESHSGNFEITEKMPLTPEEADSIDVFASVTKKSG